LHHGEFRFLTPSKEGREDEQGCKNCSHGKNLKGFDFALRGRLEKGFKSKGVAYFCRASTKDMNTQDVITPLAKFVEWTFNTVLVPMSDGLNWAVIALGLAGLAFWLRLQSKYNAKAEQDGTIM
jgi:hypothetical protein